MFLSLTTITFTSLLALRPFATAQSGLFNVAKAAGKKYFGTATDNPELKDVSYVAELSNINEFGQLTPVCLHFQNSLRKTHLLFGLFKENSMKWVSISVKV